MAKTSAQKDLEKHWAKQAKEAEKSAKGSRRATKAKDANRSKGAAPRGKDKPNDPAL